MKKRTKAVAASALIVGLMAVATPAWAEGGFTTSYSQVQPGFTSRTWTDQNSDSTSTIVTLSGCRANTAGASAGSTRISSIAITLLRNGSSVGTKTRTTSSSGGVCGAFNWGDVTSGSYQFRLASVNGITSGDRQIFLDASSINVQY